MSYLRSVRETNLDEETVFVTGDEDTGFSWRYISPAGVANNNTLQTERKEVLVETDIDLTDAKWVAVRDSGLYSPTDQYFASVLTDTRVLKTVPSGITFPQEGQIIGFDGTQWRTGTSEFFLRDLRSSTNTKFTFPFEVVEEVTEDVLRTLFVLDRETPNAIGFAREQVRFTKDLSLIKWERDWVGEGRVVQILDESDFPTAVGGLIPLERFRHYKISNNVTVQTPFLFPSNGPVEFSSENENNNDLRCEIGTQTLFQGSNSPGFIIRNLAIEDRDGGVAKLFDITQSGSNAFSKVIMTDTTFIEFASIGTLTGFNSLEMNSTRIALYSEGLTLDSNDAVRMNGNLFLGLLEGAAVDVTIKGTNGNLSIGTTVWSQDDNAIAMDIDSASTTVQGTISNSAYAIPTGGSFFKAGSKDQKDPSWRAEVNGELADSNIIASASFNQNTTVTTIATPGVPVAVNGTTVAGPLERFTHDSAGILTYTGTRDITMRIKLIASIDIVGDTPSGRYIETDNIAFCAFKNGVAEATTRDVRNIASVFQAPTSPQFVSEDNIELSPGDTIQMFVENEDNATNIIVTDLKMLING